MKSSKKVSLKKEMKDEEEVNISKENSVVTLKIDDLNFVIPKNLYNTDNDLNIFKIDNIINNENNIHNNIYINNIPSKKFNFNFDNNNNNNSINIIIVDDEMITRQSSIRIINKCADDLGLIINIEHADDGIECLYILYNYLQNGICINAILSDLNMNYMNGILLAKCISDIQKTKNFNKFPCFLLSSYDDKALSEKYSEIFEKIMNKPLNKNNFETILTIINRYVKEAE